MSSLFATPPPSITSMIPKIGVKPHYSQSSAITRLMFIGLTFKFLLKILHASLKLSNVKKEQLSIKSQTINKKIRPGSPYVKYFGD